jgi:hypothetical protein
MCVAGSPEHDLVLGLVLAFALAGRNVFAMCVRGSPEHDLVLGLVLALVRLDETVALLGHDFHLTDGL